MSRTPRSISFFNILLLCVLAFFLLPCWAKNKEASNYPLSGKVLSTSAKGAHLYQVATDSRVYLLLCEKVKGFHMSAPECKVDDRPITGGDTVEFRVEGDWAYMPAAKGAEEGLRILTTELKVIPPMPVAASVGGTGERGLVVGTGMHIQGQKMVGWSTDPSSVKRQNWNAGASSGPAMATGPVLAIPVTGGPPVMMIPTGPVGGGVMTGVPVTGGPPVVGMPIAGQAGGAAAGGGPPPWVHLLRVQAGEKIYQLQCSAKLCEVDKKEIELGDTIVIRVEKKWAYVSLVTGSGGKEQKLRILGEMDDDADADSKSPDNK